MSEVLFFYLLKKENIYFAGRLAEYKYYDMDDGNLNLRSCEGPGPTDTWLTYCGTAGKPGGKRRKQTST